MDVIILAGGRGTRLSGVVKDMPKCMADINGRPFLWYLLKYLSRYKVDKVVLALGYLSNVVIDWIDGSKQLYPFDIDYSIESTPLGTGGAIKNAMNKTRKYDVVVINGDTFYEVDLDALYERHRLLPSSVTIALKPMRDFDRYGNVKIDAIEKRIVSFEEKTHCDRGLINGGVYVINELDDVFGKFDGEFSFETDVLQPLCKKGRVFGVECNGNFIDIGIPEDYEKACRLLPKWIVNHITIKLRDVDVRHYDTLLLDRDGVINRLRPNDYVKSWEEFEFLPDVLEILAKWNQRVKYIFIVTNQRGVGKGVMKEQALIDIHQKMCDVICENGGRIDKIYYCTALTCEDERRKPGKGMFLDICRDFPDIKAERCLMIGDSLSDLDFAINCGINCAIVK